VLNKSSDYFFGGFMKSLFTLLVIVTMSALAQSAQAKTVACTGWIIKSGVKTTIPQQTFNFDPKQSETKNLLVLGDTTYQVEWDVSNHDGKPLLSVGYVSTTLARNAKGSASDIVLFLEMNPQTQDQTAVTCMPIPTAN
jgi:hypothetical protein